MSHEPLVARLHHVHQESEALNARRRNGRWSAHHAICRKREKIATNTYTNNQTRVSKIALANVTESAADCTGTRTGMQTDLGLLDRTERCRLSAV